MLTQDQQNLLDILNRDIKYPDNEKLLSALNEANKVRRFLFIIPQFKLADTCFLYDTESWFSAAYNRGLIVNKFNHSSIEEFRKNGPLAKAIIACISCDEATNISSSELKEALDELQYYLEFFSKLKNYDIFKLYLTAIDTVISNLLFLRSNHAD